jgi:hypothetical protein
MAKASNEEDKWPMLQWFDAPIAVGRLTIKGRTYEGMCESLHNHMYHRKKMKGFVPDEELSHDSWGGNMRVFDDPVWAKGNLTPQERLNKQITCYYRDGVVTKILCGAQAEGVIYLRDQAIIRMRAGRRPVYLIKEEGIPLPEVVWLPLKKTPRGRPECVPAFNKAVWEKMVDSPATAPAAVRKGVDEQDSELSSSSSDSSDDQSPPVSARVANGGNAQWVQKGNIAAPLANHAAVAQRRESGRELNL